MFFPPTTQGNNSRSVVAENPLDRFQGLKTRKTVGVGKSFFIHSEMMPVKNQGDKGKKLDNKDRDANLRAI